MLEFIKKKDKCEKLIIFVHGFTGSKSTWVKDDGKMPFIDLLLTDEEVKNNFDVAIFVYDTNLLKLFPKVKMVKNFFKGRQNRSNLPIEDISKILSTEIKYKCDDYKSIVLIGHSMGGLITKKYIIDQLNMNLTSKIGMYISLATPHSGATLAKYGNQLISNVQLTDLAPLSKAVNQLNQDWIKSNSLPKRFYAQGLNDQVVPKESSIALDKDNLEPIYSNDDHSSIIIPDNKDDIIVTAIIKELKVYLEEETDNTNGIPLQDIRTKKTKEQQIISNDGVIKNQIVIKDNNGPIQFK